MTLFSPTEILILMIKNGIYYITYIISLSNILTEGRKILPVVLRLVLQGAKVDVVVA